MSEARGTKGNERTGRLVRVGLGVLFAALVVAAVVLVREVRRPAGPAGSPGTAAAAAGRPATARGFPRRVFAPRERAPGEPLPDTEDGFGPAEVPIPRERQLEPTKVIMPRDMPDPHRPESFTPPLVVEPGNLVPDPDAPPPR